MLTKLKITIFLLLIANAQWAFILSNWPYIKRLEAISYEPTKNLEATYLSGLLREYPNRPEYKETLTVRENPGIAVGESGFTKGTSMHLEPFVPKNITIPAIDKQAPITTTRSNVDDALNRGVVNYQIIDSKGNIKPGFYIFGHSSSFITSQYQYVFTKIPKLRRGNIVTLEDDNEIRIYKYVSHRIITPENIERLPGGEGRLYLITCYPFLTTYNRYVVELVFDKKIDKKSNKEIKQ